MFQRNKKNDIKNKCIDIDKNEALEDGWMIAAILYSIILPPFWLINFNPMTYKLSVTGILIVSNITGKNPIFLGGKVIASQRVNYRLYRLFKNTVVFEVKPLLVWSWIYIFISRSSAHVDGWVDENQQEVRRANWIWIVVGMGEGDYSLHPHSVRLSMECFCLIFISFHFDLISWISKLWAEVKPGEKFDH